MKKEEKKKKAKPEKTKQVENHKKADNKPEKRINIRCRECFIIDGYVPGEETCKHCGSKIYIIDLY